jgi:branched-chain amino acid transport system substrate-binding protein
MSQLLSRRAAALAPALLLFGPGCRKNAAGTIRVGAYLSLSGPDATFGADTREGVALAIEEANAAGGAHGRRVEVLYEDDKSSAQEATQKVHQLVDRDKVVALLGEAASSRSLAGGLIANTSRVPMISPSSTAVEVTRGREWVFRTCFTDDQQGRAAAEYARGPLGKSRAAILYAAQDTYSSGLAKSFRDAFVAAGGAVVLDKGYPKGETTFRTFLGEVRAAHPDLVYVPNYYGEMVLVARHARELGMPGATFLGGDGWDSTILLEGAGQELEGALFTNHYAPDVPWPSAKAFLAAFRAKYKHDPAGGSAQGYDAALLLVDAMRRAPEPTPAAIREALAGTRDFAGATGTLTMTPERNPKKPVVVVQIKDRAFRYVAEVAAR